MKYQVVIFDWDGTLMDSTGRIASAMRQAAGVCELELPSVAEVKNIIGLSLDVAVMELFPNIKDDLVQQMVIHYKDQYRNHDKTPSPMFAGAEDLLIGLNQKGYKLAVATGKSRAGLERVWDVSNTRHLFHTGRGSDQAQSKPSPDMLNQILNELDLAVTDAVMIGDTEYDLKMASSIGMDSIGVSFGAHHVERLAKHQPKAIIDSLHELTYWV